MDEQDKKRIQSLVERKDVEGLIASLTDTNMDVRRMVAEALGDIGDERAVEPLITALNDTTNYPVFKVPLEIPCTPIDARGEAALSLGKIGGKAATEALQAVSDASPQKGYYRGLSVGEAVEKALVELSGGDYEYSSTDVMTSSEATATPTSEVVKETPIEKVIEVEASSLQEARVIIKSQIPKGFFLVSEEIIVEEKSKTVKASANTTEEAFAKAQAEIPENADIVKKKELTPPKRKVISIEAFNDQWAESSAKSQAKSQLGEHAEVRDIKLSITGSRGFLGIGKKPNQYEAEIFVPAFVEITYKIKAKISARIREYTEAEMKKQLIWEKLQRARAGALRGTKKIIGVAILYENPRGMALPDKHKLTETLVEQYRGPDFIPHNLSVDNRTPVAARELVQGKEISASAGLTTAKSNELLSEMLTALIDKQKVDKMSAIAFTGDSVALGQTFFAILAK